MRNKKTNDDIAFTLPSGTQLSARGIRDIDSPSCLSADAQQLTAMKALAPTSKIIIVHGKDDATCPFANALELVTNLQAIKFDGEVHFIGQSDLERKIFTNSGHLLGNRTEIVFKVAGNHPDPKSPTALRRYDPSDFERREDIRYPTPTGHFVMSDAKGYPERSFQSR